MSSLCIAVIKLSNIHPLSSRYFFSSLYNCKWPVFIGLYHFFSSDLSQFMHTLNWKHSPDMYVHAMYLFGLSDWHCWDMFHSTWTCNKIFQLPFGKYNLCWNGPMFIYSTTKNIWKKCMKFIGLLWIYSLSLFPKSKGSKKEACT